MPQEQGVIETKPFKTITLEHYYSPAHLSRAVWQVLFDEYRKDGGDLSHMGDMLVDFKEISNLFETWGLTSGDVVYQFYWSFTPGHWLTKIGIGRWRIYGDPNAFRVEYDMGRRVIEFYRENVA